MASKDAIQGKIRPLPNASLEKASLQGAARVYVSKSSLIALTGSTQDGRACVVERLAALDDDGAEGGGGGGGGGAAAAAAAGNGGPGSEGLRREASLWSKPAGQDLSANVVVMSKALREAAGFRLGDLVRVTVGGEVEAGGEVVVQDETGPDKGEDKLLYAPTGWEAPVAQALGRAGEAFAGMVLENVGIGRSRRSFRVLSVDGRTDGVVRFRTDKPDGTVVKIRPWGAADGSGGPGAAGVEAAGPLVLEHLPGMESERATINTWLRQVSRRFRAPTADRSCGFCVYGTQGTGKTYVLRRLEATRWAATFWIRPEHKLAAIKDTFRLARAQGRALILIDNIEELLGKDRGGGQGGSREAATRALAGELESLAEEADSLGRRPAVLVVATCGDYYADVPRALRTAQTLRRRVALPIPSEADRLAMLRDMGLLLGAGEAEAKLALLAAATHAYTPGDLATLATNATSSTEARLYARYATDDEIPDDAWCVAQEDLDQALAATQPTAMHEINLKPPTVYWADVAGQEAVKEALQYMLRFARSDPNDNWTGAVKNPPKGLLLYGPPGCSKTLSAQALATESNFNFFAVKGAELLDMYVGESERAIRRLFQRARDASPSIIFFDEIDAIAKSRSGGRGGGGASSAVNTVTTLLNEMDGFESLKQVIVVAATNRPEQMDPALLRTGRFDNMIFVGLPSEAARARILAICLRGLNLEANVDVAALARLTEGHSGAEIKALCSAAGMIALKRCAGRDEASLSMEDLTTAARRQPRRVTQGMLDQYASWARQFERE